MKATFAKIIAMTLGEEMRRDPKVLLLGEDVQTGIQGTTSGLVAEFGPERVWNTPLSESGFTGVGIGLAAVGYRPVVDLMYGTFTYVAMDQLANQAAKLRYMTGGQVTLPVTYLFVEGGGHMGSSQHSESPHGMMMNVPGLKIVTPGTGPDARGLLKASIRDNDPVLFYMDFQLLRTRWDVDPEDDSVIPLGKADVKRQGADVTLVAIGPVVPKALAAAEELAQEGIDVEVVDPRTLAPLDMETILQSVRKTGRLVVADDAPPAAGAASEICAQVAEQAFESLKVPVRRVTRPNVPVPFNAKMELYVLPGKDRVITALREIVAEPARR